MSIKLTTQVWDHADFEQTTLLVALSLADQVNDDGEGCWSSVAYIADCVRSSERTVQRAFKTLEEAGWLRRERREDRATNWYVLTVPAGLPMLRGKNRTPRGGDKMSPPTSAPQEREEADTSPQEEVTPTSPTGDTHVTEEVTPTSPIPVNDTSSTPEEPFVSPEATAEKAISDEEEVVAEPPAQAPPLKQSEVIAPPTYLDLLSESYAHREFMPNREEVAEIRERFAEHDLSKETLRGQTNAFIKWMEDRGKAPDSRGWRNWMVRYYRRIIDENLKRLGIDVQAYSPGELTQEEREAQRNELDSQEGGPDDAER